MAQWIEVVNDVVVGVVVGNSDPSGVIPTVGEWLPQPYGVGMNWTRVGAVWTGPQGQPQPVDLGPVVDLDYVLTGAEWVLRFTDNEWDWLNTQRKLTTAAGKQLNKLLDAIRWTNSVDVSAPSMDVFYNWALAQGIPGGQSRIDELRAPV